jgi:transposase
MTRALRDDLRSRVLAASRDGMSARSAAARFGIGITTAIAWIASARAGLLTPAKQGRRGSTASSISIQRASYSLMKPA